MKIAIVIINYNSWSYTCNLLRTTKLPPGSVDYYIVDNCSSFSPSTENLNIPKILNVKIIYSNANYGYLGGAELFLKKIDPCKYDWIFISNPDIELADPELLNKLQSVFRLSNSVGVWAPAVYESSHRRNQNPYLIKQPTKSYYKKYKLIYNSKLFTYIYFSLSKFKRSIPAIFPNSSNSIESIPVFAVHGSFFGLSRLFFNKGGLINDDLFLYFEEEFFGLQCKLLNLKVIYDGSSWVKHKAHATTNNLSNAETRKHRLKSLTILKKYM